MMCVSLYDIGLPSSKGMSLKWHGSRKIAGCAVLLDRVGGALQHE
jgi:hypothetical protein